MRTPKGSLFFAICVLIILIYLGKLKKSYNGIDVFYVFVGFLAIPLLSIQPFFAIRKIEKNPNFYFGGEIGDALKRGFLFLQGPLVFFVYVAIRYFSHDYTTSSKKLYLLLTIAWSFVAIVMWSYLYYREYRKKSKEPNGTEVKNRDLQNEVVKESAPTLYIDTAGGKPTYIRNSRRLIYFLICLSLLYQQKRNSSNGIDGAVVIIFCLLLVILFTVFSFQDLRRINNYSSISSEEKGEYWKKLRFLLRGPVAAFLFTLFRMLFQYLEHGNYSHFLSVTCALSIVSMVVWTVIYTARLRFKPKEFKKSQILDNLWKR